MHFTRSFHFTFTFQSSNQQDGLFTSIQTRLEGKSSSAERRDATPMSPGTLGTVLLYKKVV